MLKGKTIVLGVTGSIAAYKAVEILRSLLKLNAKPKVLMTKAATEFIAPLTFEALCGEKVITSLADSESYFKHIDLGEEADLILIAPATANIIAKLANGIADDVITTTVLASNLPASRHGKKLVVAPAMNEAMYFNKATQHNIETLNKRGAVFVGPVKGDLACSDEGFGRLEETGKIIDSVVDVLGQNQPLFGKKIVVTAGATREPIDPMRFISNKSSGKMGVAIANELYQRGAQVELIAAHPDSMPDKGVEVTEVDTALDMEKALTKSFKKSDSLIMTAAVSDFRVENVSKSKLKKTQIKSLKLEQNLDILQALASQKKGQKIIGFAAETENLISNARKKLTEKNLDLIIANNIDKKDSGPGSDYCELAFINKTSTKKFPRMLKTQAAVLIADRIEELLIPKLKLATRR